MCLLLGHLLPVPDARLAPLPLRDTQPGLGQHHGEVHAVDTDGRVVLHAEIDMFLDAEAKRAGVGETCVAQLKLFDLEPASEDVARAGTAHGRVAGNLLVAADAEAADRQPRLRKPRLLTGQLLQHPDGFVELFARLAWTDVDTELVDFYLLHRIV